MATKIVTTEDELHACIADIRATPFGGTSKTEYVIKVDTSKWDWEPKAQAKWLERHPDPRVKIEEIKHSD